MNSSSKIDILTRVEGHGTVKLVREGGKVVDARLDLHESPRLFEALVVGRRFDEIPDIACRICSICSTVHKVAALQAVEQALAVDITRQTGLLRELAVQGGQIESHALHIFCLALPDYLGVNGVQELAAHEPEKLQMGLRIKKLGNLIQETVGGRAIHPFNLLIGGLGTIPEALKLQQLKEKLAAVHGDLAESCDYILDLDDLLPPLAMLPVCAVSGGPPLFGDRLITPVETVPAASAAAWLNEQVLLHTHAKVSRFDGAAPFMVGPLARLTLAMPAKYAQYFTNTSISSSLKARMIELQLAVERAQILVDQLLDDGLKNEVPVIAAPGRGQGISLMEAPRGALLHSYRFDNNGVCSAGDIITPTAINQGAIAVSLKELVIAMDGAEYEQIKKATEILIRCFDPCISCAVH
ncbi:MAG: nickel-dependent hydrogenase large subunit [Desulfuromonadaceae bacterium]|nr:nickel-dependent hydrogenase large subunit [Desulfuromonadaceae bacterium]MDD2848825.1 nickel-dependent hydrogenase large subunit [Desulfuromonadaceae bacterium]MDD4132218.1 nickel-dependent hydrogenase large subunit [Desulfuromonadaceae bacterium]